MPPPVTARGSGGALVAPPVGFGAKPQPLFAFAFIQHEIYSDIQTSCDIRITRACACMDSDEKTLHFSQCYGSYCYSVTQSFCEFVNKACTWPCTSYMSVYKRLTYVLL